MMKTRAAQPNGSRKTSTAVTQQEIAQRLGVSQRLVSYALNGTGTVSEKTRQRVRKEARELGYFPNKAARALATGRSHLVALQVPQVASSHGTRVLAELQNLAQRDGYALVLAGGETSHAAQWPLDGILVLDPLTTIPSRVLAPDAPLVAMGCYAHLAAPETDYVALDLFRGARQAMQHLQESGCRRIVYLAAATMFRDEEPRFATFKKYGGQDAELIRIEDDELPRRAGARALRDHIEKHGVPDGLFCCNDDNAIGAARALHSLGVRVPDDVKIVGCDGIPDALDREPSLSTIELPVEAMCRLAWQMLLRRLDNPQLAPQRETLLTKLIIRDSSR